MFKLFKKPEPIREFTSDADKFDTQQIWNYMNAISTPSEVLPKSKSCEYIKNLIDRLGSENDIKICRDETKNSVRVIQLAISRNGNWDYVAISYQQFNPNVVYITTNPYFFAGDRDSFVQYSNQITIHHGQQIRLAFPLISIGCREYSAEETGNVPRPGYTLRTSIPLLGNNQDYPNILDAVKSLPIYGYDLRDGYHKDIVQPYASKKNNINIQLEKLIKIHEFKSVKNLYPAEIGLYCGAPFNKLSTEKGAVISNPFLQYLNFANSSRRFILNDDGVENWHFHLEPDNSDHTMKKVDNIELVTYTNFSTLYSIKSTYVLKKSEVDLDELLDHISSLNNHQVSNDPHEYMLFNAYVDIDDDITICLSSTQCIPNEIDAEVIAMQIADFFIKIGQSIEFCRPKEENTD